MGIKYNVLILLLILLIGSCGKDQSKQSNSQKNPAGSSEKEESALPSNASNSNNWYMFMNDISYLGVSADRILRPPLSLVWKFKTGGPVNSSPVVMDGIVYVGSDDHRIYALNARKWGVKWEFEAEDKIIYAPVVYKGNVYFGARDNKVYALDAYTGAKKWEFQTDGWINAPVAAYGGKIYAGSYDNKIYVLNADTGSKESVERSRIKIGSITYVCTHGEFYPIDAYTRIEKWKSLLSASESWPATANGFVYIGARDNKLHAFNFATRRQVWEYETDGWVDSSPAVAGGMLYAGSRDGYVYAFANADGTQSAVNALPEGVVTRDKADVYDQPAQAAKKIARLNEDMSLPIMDRKSGDWYLDTDASWYKVRLPDKRTGWINAPDFMPISFSNDLQINSSLVKKVVRLNLPAGAAAPSWSPDSSTIAFFDNTSTQSIYWLAESIWIASGDGSNPRWISNGSFFNPNISWSGNGGWFAFENLDRTQRQIWIARSNGTGLRKVTVGESPALSPSGDRVAFIRRNKSATGIWVCRMNNDTERKITEFRIKGGEAYVAYGYTASLTLPAWSRDGSRLAVGLDGFHYPDNNSRVAIINSSGGLIKELAVRSWQIRNILWSPDNKNLAFVTQERSDKQADNYLDKQVHLATLNGEFEYFDRCEGAAWSPDGGYIAFIDENDSMGIKRKVWLFDLKRRQRIQLLSSREGIEKIFWLNEGRIAILGTDRRQPSSKPSKIFPRIYGWIVNTMIRS